jgi:hypothetical protein
MFGRKLGPEIHIMNIQSSAESWCRRLWHAFCGPREVLALSLADAGDGLASADAGAGSEASAGSERLRSYVRTS